MCRCLAGQHVYRCFRAVGKQDVFEDVCPEGSRRGLTRNRQMDRRLVSRTSNPRASQRGSVLSALKNSNWSTQSLIYERFRLAFSKGDSPVGMRSSCRSPTRSASFRFRYCLAVDGVRDAFVEHVSDDIFEGRELPLQVAVADRLAVVPAHRRERAPFPTVSPV